MNLNLENTISALEEVKAQIAELKKREGEYESHLYTLVGDEVESQFAVKDYGCGTATVEVDGYQIKAVVSKRVEYDQTGLETLYNRILTAGKDPKEYLKIKFDVSETAYSNWPANVREPFEPFRKVTPSKPKLTYKKIGA